MHLLLTPEGVDVPPLVVQPSNLIGLAAGKTTWNGEGLHHWADPVASSCGVTHSAAVVTHGKASVGSPCGVGLRDVLNPFDDKECFGLEAPIAKGLKGQWCREEMLCRRPVSSWPAAAVIPAPIAYI